MSVVRLVLFVLALLAFVLFEVGHANEGWLKRWDRIASSLSRKPATSNSVRRCASSPSEQMRAAAGAADGS